MFCDYHEIRCNVRHWLILAKVIFIARRIMPSRANYRTWTCLVCEKFVVEHLVTKSKIDYNLCPPRPLYYDEWVEIPHDSEVKDLTITKTTCGDAHCETCV
jgi:hypothetical protein